MQVMEVTGGGIGRMMLNGPLSGARGVPTLERRRRSRRRERRDGGRDDPLDDRRSTYAAGSRGGAGDAYIQAHVIPLPALEKRLL